MAVRGGTLLDAQAAGTPGRRRHGTHLWASLAAPTCGRQSSWSAPRRGPRRLSRRPGSWLRSLARPRTPLIVSLAIKGGSPRTPTVGDGRPSQLLDYVRERHRGTPLRRYTRRLHELG